MTQVRVRLSNFRQSPRKVRLVAALLKGQSVTAALTRLQHQPQKSALALAKLLRSAVATASHNYSLTAESLKIAQVMVDMDQSYERFRPAARGMAHPIRRRGSTITIIVESPQQAKHRPAAVAEATPVPAEVATPSTPTA